MDGTKGKGKVAKLLWSVTDDGQVDGKVVFNGGFGFLGLGFAHPGGKHNGMNGASVILATPGGNYTAQHGLDMDLEDMVHEYV